MEDEIVIKPAVIEDICKQLNKLAVTISASYSVNIVQSCGEVAKQLGEASEKVEQCRSKLYTMIKNTENTLNRAKSEFVSNDIKLAKDWRKEI